MSSSADKIERRKSAESPKTSKSQSTERRSRTSSGSRKSFSKKASTESAKSPILPVEKINYGEEVVLIFFDCLLKEIVDEWTPTPIVVEQDEEVKAQTENPEEGVDVKDFKELTSEDLVKSQVIGVKGSQVSLTKKRTLSHLNVSQKSSKEKSKSKLVGEGDNISTSSKAKRKSSEKERSKRSSKSLTNSFSNATLPTIKSEEIIAIHDSKEWLLKTTDENVTITFKNGNVYEGAVHRKAMHGVGKFFWADGVYYEGEFCNGFITGKGKMILSDLSYYHGDFYEGLFHGDGVFYISGSSMLYSGGWKNGKKHGKGWLLYGPNNWYDGEWFEGKRQGFGIRRYLSGAVYEGMWRNNVQNGEGSMAWENSDFYSGNWKKGVLHGYGEYTWNAFFNKTLTFPILNTYQGSWTNGKRNGIGLMHFGTQGGAKLAGVWKQNLKHGPGILVCGNGRQIQNDPLFLNDKPIHIDTSPSMKNVRISYPSQDKKMEMNDEKPSLQVLAKQITSKQRSKKFENVDLKVRKETNEKCNPLEIPLHSVPEQVSFEYHILQVLATIEEADGSNCGSFIFENVSGTTANKTISTSRWNVLTLTSSASHLAKTDGNNSFQEGAVNVSNKMQYVDSARYQTEEKHLRHCVTTYLQKLRQIYDKYATICSAHELDFKPAMVRMHLWQLWRDLGIINETTSIYDVDMMLNENPYSGYETIHCPFERIYFWQFLQALLAISWFLLLKNGESVSQTGGILANCFRKFLDQYFSEQPIHVKSYSLFEFKDLLPLDAVYALYRKLGEPHTARDFLKATCVRKNKEPLCYLKNFNQPQSVKISSNKGFNAIPVGLNITYLPEETDEYQPIETIEYEDPFFNYLLTFRTLGIKTIVKCLTEVCPKISNNGMVVMIDYPLCFLEFYDVLLLCAYKVVEKKRKANEKLELLAKLEEQSDHTLTGSEHVIVVASDRKVRRNSKDKKRTKLK